MRGLLPIFAVAGAMALPEHMDSLKHKKPKKDKQDWQDQNRYFGACDVQTNQCFLGKIRHDLPVLCPKKHPCPENGHPCEVWLRAPIKWYRNAVSIRHHVTCDEKATNTDAAAAIATMMAHVASTSGFTPSPTSTVVITVKPASTATPALKTVTVVPSSKSTAAMQTVTVTKASSTSSVVKPTVTAPTKTVEVIEMHTVWVSATSSKA